MPKRGIQTALVKVGSKAITRLGPGAASLVGASQGIPVLGSVVSLGIAVVALGNESLEYVRNKRTRAALERIFGNGDWLPFLENRADARSDEEWRQRVFNCLDALKRGVAYEAVEPLIRLTQLVTTSRIEWPEARGIAATLKVLTGPEILTIRSALKEGSQSLPTADAIDFLEKEVAGEWLPFVANRENPGVRLSGVTNLLKVLNVLAANNVCQRDSAFFSENSPNDTSDRFCFNHSQLRSMLTVFCG